MGTIALPKSGRVYVDTNVLIYTVETHPQYWPMLAPFWAAAQAGRFSVVTSQLTIMEALVGPTKSGDAVIVAAYERTFKSPSLGFLPIDEPILRVAARLRATINKLRTPDAIHAATALLHPVGLFLTNDDAFRKVPGLPVTVLSHLVP